MVKDDIGYLIGTGVALGFIHVLTGPDHLSALATLSANVGNHLDAALLGVRWGIGHSSGLLLVGTVLIILSQAGQDTVDMPDAATHFFESIVGVFMLLLGVYGIRKAWLKRPATHYDAIDNQHSPGKLRVSNGEKELRQVGNDGLFKIDSEDAEVNNHGEGSADDGDPLGDSASSLEIQFDGDDGPVCIPPPVFRQLEGQGGSAIMALSSDDSEMEEAVVVEQAYMDTVSPSRCRRLIHEGTSRLSAKTIAFLAGIVHGLAGPGGVLGVIPAVQLQNWKLAAVYLSCFCISSTLTMGCFATAYGACSSKIVSHGSRGREFQIECMSASLSILVGITWLTLLALGKLEDVFP
ncbi:expressed unknown protein [Seminavis robusta]|uniref:Uncharacterized protein n=1 Tax=Seminavis robusta TaxID=568900 RepID=A0A9N8DR01_9STRA|nr:expressed unknown protein [Seminavis robusta]|eukprot:Sro219_g090410.1 n/a (351) ;mRNA; f:36422-37474